MSLFGILSFKNLKKSLEKQYKNESEFVLKQTVATFEYQFSNVENILEQLAQSQILKSEHPRSEEDTTLLQIYQKISPTNGKIVYGLENGGFYQGNT